MRKHYLDNLRWATVILVLVYHVFYIFNGLGIPGAIPGAKNIPAFDWAAGLIYPWFMVLLFVIAGMSARYALQKRTAKQFLRERAVKLLLPSTLGLFAVHWITGYLNIKIGGGLEYIPKPLLYPISALSGIGPLWFIQMLFLFSCALILLRKADREDKIWALCGKADVPFILSLSVLIFGAAQILNMPVLTMYRFGIYFTAFLIGYYVFSHEEVQARIEKMRVPMACLTLAGAALYAGRWGGMDYTAPRCLESLITNLYLWAAVLALLGFGRRYLNVETAFSRYMARSSFGVYILHYPGLMLTGYILHSRFNFRPAVNYALALGLETAFSFAAYELFKRIPLVNLLVLGMSRKTEKSR